MKLSVLVFGAIISLLNGSDKLTAPKTVALPNLFYGKGMGSASDIGCQECFFLIQELKEDSSIYTRCPPPYDISISFWAQRSFSESGVLLGPAYL